MDDDAVARIAVDVGFKLHQAIGPGLLESAYEALMADQLVRPGLHVERQRMIPISYEGTTVEAGFRADLIVNNRILIELKSVEKLAPVHAKQLLTYLRFANLRIGLLINFGAPAFKQGIKRIVNDPPGYANR